MAKQPVEASRADIEAVVLRSRLAGDLLDELDKPLGRGNPKHFPVIIELNNNYPGGARQARARLLGDYLHGRIEDSDDYEPGPERELLMEAAQAGQSDPIDELTFEESDRLFVRKSAFTDSYIFGELTAETLKSMVRVQAKMEVRAASEGQSEPLIYKIWLDRECGAFINQSYRTVKCDAGQAAFGARGQGILWAVADTGIQGDHPHFARHNTLDLRGIKHRDFTGEDQKADESALSALVDHDGHGTHVAGIIAGETIVHTGSDKDPTVADIVVTQKRRVDSSAPETFQKRLGCIAGIAPETKLLSLKVLTDKRSGKVSMVLAAIGYIQRINEYGRNLRIHGLNLSLGYAFDPEWFAAGQSPLCKEVDRLVKSGVVVVAAAGNGGYGPVMTQSGQAEKAAHASTIADPGNAELAITVGATHRDSPHEYGVSYFSGKGPTADGRSKPDLVAPGERIISCGKLPNDPLPNVAYFEEATGTSMAAPHVSAVVAAFLSVRSEFKGKPEQVKTLFLANATDLGRRREFQGAGLIDLMRTLQAV